jgi:hypothetical protein
MAEVILTNIDCGKDQNRLELHLCFSVASWGGVVVLVSLARDTNYALSGGT